MAKDFDREELIEKINRASYRSVNELIKVLEAPIIKEGETFDGSDQVAVEKMKTAASAKRLAQEDAYAILDNIQKKEKELAESRGEEVEETKKKISNTDNVGPASRAK